MPNPFALPSMPAELAEVIAAHKALFGGFTMMADENTDPPGGDESTADDKDAKGGDDFKSEHSKTAVLRDLATERDKRQALEAEVAKLAPLQKLVEALAPDAKGEDSTQAALDAFNKRLDDEVNARKAAEHRALVAEHAAGLSDEDKAILSEISDPDVMGKVAARMRDAASAEQLGNARRNPRPDRSAGQGGDGKSSGSLASGRDLYEARHPRKN